MAKLLMISGDTALATGKKGAFYNTMEEFHKHWERVDVICPNIGRDNQPMSYFENVYFHPSPWPIVWQSWWIYNKGLELFNRFGFDVMVVHEYPPFYNGFGAMALHKKIKVPYMEEFFHIVGYPKAANIKEALYKIFTFFIAAFITSAAKKVRVMNKMQVPAFLKKAGVKKNKIQNISALYIDSEAFKPQEAVKTYDLIFVGRVVENKGIKIFLEAIEKSHFRGIIVGQGPLLESLKKRAENLKISERVAFYGWAKGHQEIGELINKSKVLVMTSFNEGGPRVVLEAMACGVPVLATPVGIVPDLVAQGYPFSLNSWTSEELVRKAELLLSDEDLYNKIRNSGLEITKNYNKEAMIKNYADSLKALI